MTMIISISISPIFEMKNTFPPMKAIGEIP